MNAPEEERLPCPRCGESSLAIAMQCFACGLDLLVNLEVSKPPTDKRQAYTIAKTICAKFPNLTFTTVQAALTGGERALLKGTTRSVAGWLGSELSQLGVETAVRWPETAPVRRQGSGPWRTIGSVIGVLWALSAIAYAYRTHFMGTPGAHDKKATQARAVSATTGDAGAEVAAAEGPRLGAREIAARVVPSTATVLCGESQGSGFFIKPDLAITNQHVCDDETVTPKLVLDDGRELIGAFKRRVERLDAVLIEVVGAKEATLPLGDSTALRRGDSVYIVGAPLRMGFTLSQGVVSHPTRRMMGLSYVQLDLSTSPGNSGGPLVDAAGRVVGLVTYKIGPESVMGLALAINHLFTGEEPLLPAPASYDKAAWLRELEATSKQDEKDRQEAQDELKQPILVRARQESNTVYAAIAYLGDGAPPKRVRFDVSREGAETCTGIKADVGNWRNLEGVSENVDELAPSARAWAKENGLELKPRMGVASFSIRECPGDMFRPLSLKLQGGLPGSDTTRVSR